MNYNNLKAACAAVNLIVGVIIITDTLITFWEKYKQRKARKQSQTTVEATEEIAAPATSPTSTPA